MFRVRGCRSYLYKEVHREHRDHHKGIWEVLRISCFGNSHFGNPKVRVQGLRARLKKGLATPAKMLEIQMEGQREKDSTLGFYIVAETRKGFMH